MPGVVEEPTTMTIPTTGTGIYGWQVRGPAPAEPLL